MENLHDVLQHLVRAAHFRSEEDRAKASGIVTEAFSEPEPEDNPDVPHPEIPPAPVLKE